MASGDVFITGRIKDIIIRAGRHLYPQEIEEAVGLIPGMRKGCVAVFGAPIRALRRSVSSSWPKPPRPMLRFAPH